MSDSVPEAGARDEAAAAEPQAPPGPEYEPAGPAPLGVVRTPTGDPEVDARLERLADADHLTTDGHVEVYEDVHRGLRDALTALDARPGPPAPPSTHHHRS
ncbi:hypothetical protein ABZT03_16955 [Streptomyces sp. NPDC005574]|uniref:hypothetical protein n=1 Tax=Streptomyces sp. NPDC005574 TaxID=3156891 RepID=UPI0033AD8209